MKIQIILGSTSDMPVADKAKKILDQFTVEYDIKVASAHRTPDVVEDLVKNNDAQHFKKSRYFKKMVYFFVNNGYSEDVVKQFVIQSYRGLKGGMTQEELETLVRAWPELKPIVYNTN